MKKGIWKRVMSSILTLVMVFGLSGTLNLQHVEAAEKAKITISADKTEVKRGDIITYSIDLSGNETGVGLTLRLLFDNTKIEPVDSDDAIVKGNVISSAFMGDPYAIKDNGRFGVVVGSNDPLKNGNVITAKFKVTDTASGSIKFEKLVNDLANYEGDFLDFTYVDATAVSVVVPATGITVDKDATTIVKGATDKIIASLVPADANGTITWSTSDSSVATVSNDGTVTAVNNGTATITAKCGDFSAQTKVTVINPLKAIKITGTTHSLKKGQTTQLGLTYDPADTTDSAAATWTSSDPSVATVSKTGLVTALKDGSTTIKATVGNVSNTYDITVKEIKLTGIKMDSEALIHEGDTKTLSIEYTPADTTDDKTVSWSSSDSTVASVDNNGTVTAVKPGSAVITAKVGNHQAACTVTVDAPLKEIVPANDTIDMVKKQTANITYTFVPADTTDRKDVTFTSSDVTVASVDTNGKVTANKAGQATITITGANGINATVTVNVSEIPINEVVLSAKDEIVEVGAKKTITATLKPDNNTDDDQNVTWTSSDSTVVKVVADKDDSHKAVIEGVAGGTAVITATAANGTTAICTVKVPKHMSSVELPESVEIKKGASTLIDIAIAPKDTDDDTTFTWASSDDSIVKVDEKTGMVYGIKAGEAEVTATSKVINNATGKPYTATTKVIVKENHMTDEIGKLLTFDEFDDLFIGQTCNAYDYLNLAELINKYDLTDDIKVEFATSDAEVATIDNDGNIYGLKAGKATITVTVTAIAGDGSKDVYTAEKELTVKAISLNSIAFNKVIKEMQVGATDTLSIIYNPENTTDAKDVTWTSSNPNVISVENGKLTAIAVGTADITAKVGDKTVTCTITVKEAEKKDNGSAPVITKKNDNSNNNAKPADKSKATKKAKTGDNNKVVLFLVMMGAAVAMIATVMARSLRRNRR